MAYMELSGLIDKNYDYWAVIGAETFAQAMYDFAEDNNIGVAFEHEKGLGGKKNIIQRCNISMYFSNEPLTLEEAQERFLDNYFSGTGVYEMEANYTGYSEWTITGYDLDQCQLGGHNLNTILLSHIGEYANIVVEAD